MAISRQEADFILETLNATNGASEAGQEGTISNIQVLQTIGRNLKRAEAAAVLGNLGPDALEKLKKQLHEAAKDAIGEARLTF